MTNTLDTFRFFLVMLVLVALQHPLSAQDDRSIPVYKNQVATNLLLPFLGSFDLTYERTLGKKFAIGIAGALYGDAISKISTDHDGYLLKQKTNYEIMPLARIYFSGHQKRSHFVELFGSVSGVDESGRLLRSVNDEGFGVYEIGTQNYIRGGVGGGYGYRFLFLEGRLVAEAQFGIRTNFEVDYFILNATLVRTGIKMGYRF